MVKMILSLNYERLIVSEEINTSARPRIFSRSGAEFFFQYDGCFLRHFAVGLRRIAVSFDVVSAQNKTDLRSRCGN